MNRFINRLSAAFDVLFKKDVIVMTIYEQHATLWSSIEDDERVGYLLKVTGEYIAPDDSENVIFDEQNNY